MWLESGGWVSVARGGVKRLPLSLQGTNNSIPVPAPVHEHGRRMTSTRSQIRTGGIGRRNHSQSEPLPSNSGEWGPLPLQLLPRLPSATLCFRLIRPLFLRRPLGGRRRSSKLYARVPGRQPSPNVCGQFLGWTGMADTFLQSLGSSSLQTTPPSSLHSLRPLAPSPVSPKCSLMLS